MAAPLIPIVIGAAAVIGLVLAGKKSSAAPAKHPINVPGFPVVPDGCGPSGDLDNPWLKLVNDAMTKETDPAKLDELANAFDTATPPCPATAARIRARAAALRTPPKPGTPAVPGVPKAPTPGVDRPPVGYFPVGRKEGGFDVYRTTDDQWWIFPAGFGKPAVHIAQPSGTTEVKHAGYTATSRTYTITDDDGVATKYQIWTSDSDHKDYIFVFGAPIPVHPGSGGF